MSSPVQVGEIVAGKYRVDAVLGQGGMGIVVAATDTILDRRVAVKFLLPQYAENQVASGRFLREAKATARLNSEHAVRIIEVGELDRGGPFMAMEFLQGVDLGTYIEQQGALEIRAAVDYVIQAARGLAEAHKAGIIHRDVKPSNLFLAHQASGRTLVKVLDFGVSKLNLGVDANSGSLTTTGQTLGSPLYMSPEQMRSSQSADARSDIWGLGVVLFELLTGARPFSAESLTELVLVINQEAPLDPKVLRPDLPDTLCAMVLRCLEKDPNRRYQTVSELTDDLSTFGSRDSRAAARDIKGLMDSGDLAIPGAPPVGSLGTMIAPSGASQGIDQSSIDVNISTTTGGAQPAGSMTSAPWASTNDGAAKAKSGRIKKGAGLGVMLAAVLGSGALLIVVLVVALWPSEAEEKKDDSAILSAASELSESAERERATNDDTEPTDTAAPNVTASLTAAVGTAGDVPDAATGETGESDAEDAKQSDTEEQKPPRVVRPRVPRDDQPKSPKERLGF